MIAAVPEPEDDDAPAPIRYRLTEDEFWAWWSSAITPDDADRAVHLHRCNIVHSRFVCALDLLRRNHPDSGDLIMRAYLMAAEIPEEHARDHVHRVNAAIVSDFPGVVWLLEQVQYRSERQVAARIARRTARRIEKLLDRTASIENDDTEVSQEAMEMQRVVLTEANKYLTTVQRREIAEGIRADKAALTQAIREGGRVDQEKHALPTGKELEILLLQAREALGADKFGEIIEAVSPKKLS